MIENLDAPYDDDREGVVESDFVVQMAPEPRTLLLFAAGVLGVSSRRYWPRREKRASGVGEPMP
jgi:hypothetical protein